MRAVRQFSVVPAVPEALAPLRELAANVAWTWDRQTKHLFERLDPAAWERCEHDPLHLLATISSKRWADLAADPSIVEQTAEAHRRLRQAIEGPQWFQSRSDSPLHLVAYFSPEFGLTETLPQYSGGLGVLAGDHLKATSDLGVPLVGIGLLYAEGYFRQRLNADGFQEEHFPRLDPSGLAIHDTGLTVTVDVAGDQVAIRIWQVDVGRVRLYLLDTAVDGNSEAGYDITDRLYGGDAEHRLRQEIVLGIGGVRALRALGLEPEVFHTNEGHAGFLSLERIRELVAAGLSFTEAVEAVRAGGVFTTHTPVPAGIDRFERSVMEKYFGAFATACGTDFATLMRLGHRDDEPDETRFNMAVMGLRLGGRSNGVAQLHGAVSREMFNGLWPDIPTDEVPIGAITNGVHAHTWVSDEVDALLRRSVGGMWDGADAEAWAKVDELSSAEIWAARSIGRTALVEFVRSRLGEALLDPEALTIGFARRFATYKRATLLLSQPDRLREMLTDSDRPVQFVFAGKAHPADNYGKELIRDIELFARQLDVGHRFLFVPDYDMAIARMMYHGCDVWLNNPRRPLEACGTSGMKAALNGALNCSILDGWWDECYDGDNGWAITSADDDPDLVRRDQREATSLFGLLEREIVPLFHKRTDGLPEGWISMMKHNWASLGPFVTAAWMVRDYTTDLYEPAAASARSIAADDWRAARELAAWKTDVMSKWSGVKVVGLDADSAPAHEGDVRHATAHVELDGLRIEDVAVQILHGAIASTGDFVGHPEIVPMTHVGDNTTFECTYTVRSAGVYGLTLRVIPTHPAMVAPVDSASPPGLTDTVSGPARRTPRTHRPPHRPGAMTPTPPPVPPTTPPVPHNVYVRRRIVAAVLAVVVLFGGLVLINQVAGGGSDDGVSGSQTTLESTTVSDPSPTDTEAPTSDSTSDSTDDSTGDSNPSVTGDTSGTAAGASTTIESTAPVTLAPGATPLPTVDAVAYGVYDMTAGRWMADSQADAPRAVGSLMKLLTAYVIMQAGDLTKVVTVPALTMDPAESAIGLYQGEELERATLLRAMLIVSANDAAKTLAIDNAGSEDAFVVKMNAAAQELGLTSTVAANSTGLDASGAQSTTRDMVTLGALLMQDPDFRTTVARTDARLHGQTYPATNDLLTTYVGADGIKTGSTTQAGECLLGSATRDGRTIIVAVLGSSTEESRVHATAALLDWAYANP